jgi:hypothetical protein
MPQSGISEKLVRFCSPWSLDDMQMQMAQNWWVGSRRVRGESTGWYSPDIILFGNMNLWIVPSGRKGKWSITLPHLHLLVGSKSRIRCLPSHTPTFPSMA